MSVFEIQDTYWENTTSNKTGTLKTEHGHCFFLNKTIISKRLLKDTLEDYF